MLSLNMIVKNEGERIERALKSAAPYISSYVILDTGSTDDTKERITGFFRDAAIPGEVVDGVFKDFGQARNDALTAARARAKIYLPQWYLLMDADMELVVKDAGRFLEDRHGACYEMYQYAGAVHYTNARLLSAAADGVYKGPTHEYLDVQSAGRIPEDVAFFNDHADGSNRVDKFKRDIRLLTKGLKEEPDNARYMYYLASSYRDAGKPMDAAKWFRRRIAAGGWEEEVWHAHVCLAHALKDAGDTDGFVANLMAAYCRRPTRAEAMYDLSRWYREQPHMQAAAVACAEAVEHLPLSTDSLFVNDYVYQVGIKEEISIAGGYVPGKAEKARRLTDELSIKDTPYWTARACARANTYWYLKPLGEMCPSFKWKNIAFTPPSTEWDTDTLVVMNPSVTMHDGQIFVNMRAVNYRIDNDGRYIIKATDGTANAENPIDTRNFVINMGLDPMRAAPVWGMECYRPGNIPCEFPLVTGFEDVRLFSWGDALWSSATVRQIAADGQCEQVLSRIDLGDGRADHTNTKRMLREPRETEKNWSPIINPFANEQLFVWRPGVVVNTDGKAIINTPQPFTTDNISGSSQVIPWVDGGYITIVHTAHPLPNEPYKRHYYHRFVEYGPDLSVTRMSLPFYFNEKGIEFCAGMCRHPVAPLTLVISYGFKDCEARIATVDVNEVEKLLEGGHVFG